MGTLFVVIFYLGKFGDFAKDFCTSADNIYKGAVCTKISLLTGGIIMEIKGINGIISTYKTNKNNAQKKTAASAVNRTNTDRVEFGFERAIAAAKAEIAAAAKADASPKELLEAQQTAEQGVDSSSIADLILMG